MKHFLLKTMLLLCALVVGSSAWAEDYEELFSISAGDVVSGSSYKAHTATVDSKGYVITFGGNNSSVGTNSGNRSNCNLSSYSKYAVSPVTTSSTASAFACTTSISDVSKISYTFSGGSNQTNTNVYLLYSEDNTTFSKISLISGTQGATISSGTAYTFAKTTGYFALLFEATNTSGNWRIDGVSITFYKEKAPDFTINATSNDEDMGTVSLTGSTITATPKTGYRVSTSSPYTVSSGTATVTNNGDNTFTVAPSSDCTVQINFEAIPTHAATFSVNGSTTSQDFAEGAEITFPSDPVDINGKKFVGWVSAAIDGTTNTAPSFVTSATMSNSNVTYYAVFAEAEESGAPTYQILDSDAFDDEATYVIGAKQASNNSTMWYLYSYANIDANVDWGVMTNDPAANKPITFKLSGTASALVAKDNNGNYLEGLTSGKFKMSSTSKTVAISSVGSIRNASNSSYLLRHNYNGGNGGLRWYNSATGVVTNFYKVIPNYVYSDYCTTVNPSIGSFAEIAAQTVAKDNTQSFDPSAAFTPADGVGIVTYTVTSEDDDIADYDSGEIWAYKRGTTTFTVTATADGYSKAKTTFTVNVTAPVVVSAGNVTMTYGDAAKAINATTSAEYVGTLTYSSGNTNVATVDASGNVTAKAAGTTTITISAPDDIDHLYTACAGVGISVTVNAPEGGTTAPEEEENYMYYETLLSTSFPTNWTGDGTVWNGSSSYGAQTGTDTSGNGTAGETYDLVTCDYDLSGYTDLVVDFDHTGKSFSDPSSACNVYIQEGTSDPVRLDITYFGGVNFNWENVRDIDISSYEGKTVKFIFRYTPSANNDGKWQVKNFGIYGKYKTITATLNTSGYATFCSEYPLDFSATTDVTAWQITDISSSNVITFEKVTGAVKGGTGLFLVGTAGETVNIPSADSDNELTGNLLVGTTAPTYLPAGVYGLSGDSFKKSVNAGVIKANRAYLPGSFITESGDAPIRFEFVDEATGISEMKTFVNDSRIYNLNGQEVKNPTRGIYIQNGKKVFIK